MERATKPNLSNQMKKHASAVNNKKEEYDGNFGRVISTGSTQLDLAISGGRIHKGGLPGGILVEIFGPSGSGKTVLLSEIGGAVQRQGGELMIRDPEARINKRFAKLFDLDIDEKNYSRPNTIPEVFSAVRYWNPPAKAGVIHGIITDGLAALSTDQEMENKEGDKMGMRRAKEFSEELRKTCRILADKNYLMVCSNQVRVNIDAGPYGQKYSAPGGESIGFYSSLRLRTLSPQKITEKRTVSGQEVKRVVGVKVQVEVYKSSIWKPYRTAPVTIIFDYGIDDIQDCLQFIKDHSRENVYHLDGQALAKSMKEAISIVEKEKLEESLRKQVILKWNEIESQFDSQRKPKTR